MSRTVCVLTMEWLQDAIAGRIETQRPKRLTSNELAAYNEAVICGWISTPKGKRTNLHHAYWAYCAIQSQPFVCVRPRRLYAAVGFDFIASQKRLTDRGHAAIGDLLQSSLDRVSDLRPGAIALWGKASGFISDVRVEDAGEMAAAIWASITAPGNWEWDS